MEPHLSPFPSAAESSRAECLPLPSLVSSSPCFCHKPFGENKDCVYLHTRSDGRPFNLARLRAKTKARHVTIREVLFADNAALATHTQEALQRLINCCAHACEEFGLTSSIKRLKCWARELSPSQIFIYGVKNSKWLMSFNI